MLYPPLFTISVDLDDSIYKNSGNIILRPFTFTSRQLIDSCVSLDAHIIIV